MFIEEDIIRHEAGHAVVAHKLGLSVDAMVWRVSKNRSSVQGDVAGSFAGNPNHITILAAGFVADYLNSRMLRIIHPVSPFIPTVGDMITWELGAFSNMAIMSARAKADADLKEIRRAQPHRSFNPARPASIADAPPQDVQYAIDILNKDWDLLCDLVEYAGQKKPGIGSRELRRFFAGEPTDRWTRIKDKPVVWAVRFEQWKFRDKNR
jgi:hypothetical protein